MHRFPTRPLFLLLALAGLGPALAVSAQVVPDRVIVLYDGKTVKDLGQFYKWLGPLGRDNDPHQVFTLVDRVDGAPAIRVSGQDWGGITTREEYANYINGRSDGFGTKYEGRDRRKPLPLLSQPVYYAVAGSKDDGRGFKAVLRELADAIGFDPEDL